MKVIILLFSSLLTVHVGSEYTDEYGREMLAMSAAAFARNPGICLSKIMPKEEKWILISANEAVCDKRSDKCAVFVAISHIVRKILVSFRGTNTITQLVAESLDILKEEYVFYDLGRVDTYFLNALEKVWHPVRKVLADFDLINYDVVFTGYSLGGALASIASLKAYKDNLRASNKISLITYGMPRVGNYLFASNHDRIITNSYRIVHK
uniref:Lipase_3 domain-containing protein n=1 Tax=Rhabditophanes sp. KR3021 TaxID=114890 RepID=A0AC35TSS5_9BILA